MQWCWLTLCDATSRWLRQHLNHMPTSRVSSLYDSGRPETGPLLQIIQILENGDGANSGKGSHCFCDGNRDKGERNGHRLEHERTLGILKRTIANNWLGELLALYGAEAWCGLYILHQVLKSHDSGPFTVTNKILYRYWTIQQNGERWDMSNISLFNSRQTQESTRCGLF